MGKYISDCTGGRGCASGSRYKLLIIGENPGPNGSCLAGVLVERKTDVEGIGDIGKYATKSRGADQSGGDILYGGGTCGAFIQLVVLGPVDGNGENSGRDKHRVPVINHGEAGA